MKYIIIYIKVRLFVGNEKKKKCIYPSLYTPYTATFHVQNDKIAKKKQILVKYSHFQLH